MRVLTISWEYPPHVVGGMGKHVYELTRAFAARHCDMHVLTPNMRGGETYEYTPEGVHVHRVEVTPQRGGDFATYVEQVNNSLEQEARRLFGDGQGFDLVHTHDWLGAHAGVALKHAWRLPLVATIHATERGRGRGQSNGTYGERIEGIEWWLTYEAWRVITCSHFMADQVHTYFKTPRDKIDVVPNGVHILPDPWSSTAERQAFRLRYAEPDQPLVLYVGRIVYEKGVQVLLDAWSQVLAAQPNARLVIAGTGNYLDTVKAQAQELGIDSTVTFAGFIADEERDRLYHVADVAAFPSLYEPFGIVALEAMAARCPVVAAHTGGLAEVVRPHDTGVLVEPNDPNSLGWGLIHTLNHPEWAQVRAENAISAISQTYTWKQVTAATLRVYARTYAAWQAGTWGHGLIPSLIATGVTQGS